MRAVIICGGAVADYGYIKAQISADDTVICADSGYDHAVRMCLVPHMVVGDFDSISRVPEDIACVRYPAEKDMTDTEIAISHARALGFSDFLIVAGTGSRMDHTLANIFLLKGFLDRGEYAEIIDEHNRIMITDSGLDLCGHASAVVSLIPLTDCLGVTTTNLRYPLHGAELDVGTSLGISNIMTEATAHVSVRKGILLVIMARD